MTNLVSTIRGMFAPIVEETKIVNEAPEDKEPASPDEAQMAMKQLEFISYAAKELKDHIKSSKEFPEWMQNKLSKLHGQMEGLHSSMGEHGEDEDEEEMKEQAPVAPVPGDKWKNQAVMVNGRQRVVIDRKNMKNYPAKDGWKEVSPGQKVKEDNVKEESTPYYNKPSFLKRMSNAAKQERLAREKKEKEKEKENKPVKEEIDMEGLEEGFVVKYHTDKGEHKNTSKVFADKAAADAHAKRGNMVDKVGGKYTVHKVNEKGAEVKEETVSEALDKRALFHKSVENGVFQKSKYGSAKNRTYLHDTDRKSGTDSSQHMLATFDKKSHAVAAAKKHGGNIETTSIGTHRIYKEEVDEQVVAEAGNKPVEKLRLGMGDTRTARELKTHMQGAGDQFVKKAAKDVGPFHSRVAKMQGKLAKSELRRRGIKEEVEQIDEANIVTVTGRTHIRPGTKHSHTIVKDHGIHNDETGEQHRVFTVKQPNGFHGVLVTDKDKSHVVGQTHRNHSKEEASKIGDHYIKHGQVGMSKHDPWYIGGDKIVKEEAENLGEEATADQINQVLGSTKTASEGLAAIKKAFKVDDKGAKALMKKVMGEEVDFDNLEEGWEDMLKSVKDMSKPKPNGGTGKKAGRAYGGAAQKDEKKPKTEATLHPNQKKLDVDGDGKIEKSDLKKLRDKKTPGTGGKESIEITPKVNEASDTKPGWMLRADPELKKKMDDKIKLAKLRQKSYGDKSAGKSVNEETDFLDDLLEGSEMTDAEMKNREKIVKSMKKKTGDFKDRYGDRWKSVMYATATKMANK